MSQRLETRRRLLHVGSVMANLMDAAVRQDGGEELQPVGLRPHLTFVLVVSHVRSPVPPQAAEVERQLSTQVHSLRDDFREKNASSSQHVSRLENLQAEVRGLGHTEPRVRLC